MREADAIHNARAYSEASEKAALAVFVCVCVNIFKSAAISPSFASYYNYQVPGISSAADFTAAASVNTQNLTGKRNGQNPDNPWSFPSQRPMDIKTW